MTVIVLGTVSLWLGMTKADATARDELIRKANHGKAPVDKDGKPLQSNVSLFIKYDVNKDGVIDGSEYQKYREDSKKEFDDKMKKTTDDMKIVWGKLKTPNTPQKNFIL